MSYDIAIIDHRQRFVNSKEFNEWYNAANGAIIPEQQNTYRNTTPNLQQWFMKMKDVVRPLNGEFAPPDDEIGGGVFPEAEYDFEKDFIYVSLGWTEVERTRAFAFDLAKECHLAYFDISGTSELHNADGTCFKVSLQQAYTDAYKEESQRVHQKQNTLTMYVACTLSLVLLACFFFKDTWGIYVGIPTLVLLVAFAYWSNRWMNNASKKLLVKYSKEYTRQIYKQAFNSVNEDLIFSETTCVQEIINPVWFSIDTSDYKTYQEDKARFTKEQIYIVAVQWYDSEVNNGGHYQFFTNSTGIYWKEAIAGLRAIGATALAENLQKACDRFSPHPPFDHQERENAADALNYDFSQEDDIFYQNAGNLEELEMKYIRANAQAFVISPLT